MVFASFFAIVLLPDEEKPSMAIVMSRLLSILYVWLKFVDVCRQVDHKSKTSRVGLRHRHANTEFRRFQSGTH